jgi:uncharacterized protein YecE (DUF72 family)
LEVRHDSFKESSAVELLRRHDVGLVVADTAGKWPFMEDVTTDFVYVRLHGDSELYVSGYTPNTLARWSRKVLSWSTGKVPAKSKLHAVRAKPRARGRDVFVYFDNDVKVRAPFDAMSLAHRLHLGPAPAAAPEVVKISETPRQRWPGFTKRKA